MNGLFTGESGFMGKVDFTKNKNISIHDENKDLHNIPSFFLVSMKINAQNEIHVDTIPFCYFNGITKQAQNINEIQVTNNLSEEYLTWISLILINKKSNNDLIYDFLKKERVTSIGLK